MPESTPESPFPRTCELPDGTTGYFVRLPRLDDCFSAAVATVLQVPIDDVPDPRIDERLRAGDEPHEIDGQAWNALDDWLAARRLRIVLHRIVPACRRRWIGVVPFPGDFQHHCLVMAGDQLLFDPQADMRPTIPELLAEAREEARDVCEAAEQWEPMRTWRPIRPSGIRWGFSFQRTPTAAAPQRRAVKP
jgi:hypothetical protein